jgi:hypothetical protein
MWQSNLKKDLNIKDIEFSYRITSPFHVIDLTNEGQKYDRLKQERQKKIRMDNVRP